MKKIILFIPLFFLICTSCISITYFPLFQKLHLRVEPRGATFEVLGNGVVLQKGKTPAVIKVRKAHGLVIRFSKEDHYNTSVYLQLQGDGNLYPASIALGMLSVFAGYFVDRGSGAIYKMRPNIISFRLEPQVAKLVNGESKTNQD